MSFLIPRNTRGIKQVTITYHKGAGISGVNFGGIWAQHISK